MPAIDLDAAVATYWSNLRVGIDAADVVAAWSAAAAAVWKDEWYVESHEGATQAEFLFNSGHVRDTVSACSLLVGPRLGPTVSFLTVVWTDTRALGLGWALHTRTLDATWGDGWPNPSFGEEARRSWSRHEALAHRTAGDA